MRPMLGLAVNNDQVMILCNVNVLVGPQAILMILALTAPYLTNIVELGKSMGQVKNFL